MPELTPLPRSGSFKRSERRTLAAAPSRTRRWVKYAFIFITVAVVVNAIAGNRGLVQAWRMHREHQALSAEIARLTRENQRLDQQNRRLREDPKAIEEEARRRLGLIRKGERVYVIKDVASPSKPAPPRTETAPSPARPGGR